MTNDNVSGAEDEIVTMSVGEILDISGDLIDRMWPEVERLEKEHGAGVATHVFGFAACLLCHNAGEALTDEMRAMSAGGLLQNMSVAFQIIEDSFQARKKLN